MLWYSSSMSSHAASTSAPGSAGSWFYLRHLAFPPRSFPAFTHCCTVGGSAELTNLLTVWFCGDICSRMNLFSVSSNSECC